MGVGPLPAAEVGRVALQQLVGQGDVVVEVLAIGQVDPADRIAAAERLGLLGGLVRLGDGQHALLFRQLPLLFGPVLLAADQDDPGGQRGDGREQQGGGAGHDRLVPAAPAGQPRRCRLAVGRDRLVGQPAVDLLGQRGGRGVSVFGPVRPSP